MSRSNPNTQSQHPAKRWFQWNGEVGNLRYYDKETEVNVEVPIPFEFMLLDKLSTIRGWHDPSQSGIYSNEIRSTIDEPMTVKAFKMLEPLGKGFYQDIKDSVKAKGGKFHQNLYIAFHGDDGELQLGSIMLGGAAMSAWIDFENEHKKEVYKQGIRITEFTEHTKGKITFRKPVFELFDLPDGYDLQANQLDQVLQEYLGQYFNRKPDVTPPQKAVEQALEETTHQLSQDDSDDIPF